MRKVSKAKANVYHARKRAMERYGIFLDKPTMNHLIGQIQGGDARHVETVSNTRSIFDVRTQKNVPLRVVYCKTTKTLITVLPPEKVAV